MTVKSGVSGVSKRSREKIGDCEQSNSAFNNNTEAGTAQREGLGGLQPPYFFARIKINLTKNNLTKVTE